MKKKVRMKMDLVKELYKKGYCLCKDCTYYEAQRDYPDCSQTLPWGYCYYWEYETGESPNSVDEDDFCSRGRKDKE